LQTAIDLASLWAEQKKLFQAKALLNPLIEQFREGEETQDIQSAERLLAGLS
jgi:hypothetical protein